MIDPNVPAFPSAMIRPKDYGVEGLTIRAYFAARAMQGIISQAMGPITDTEVAKRAVWCADALVAELNKAPVGQSYEEQQEGPQ